jgi:hypothetical protein
MPGDFGHGIRQLDRRVRVLDRPSRVGRQRSEKRAWTLDATRDLFV